MSRSHRGLSGALFEMSKDVLEIVHQKSEFEPVKSEVYRTTADLEYSPTSWSLERSHERINRSFWPQSVLTEVIEEGTRPESYEEVVGILEDRINEGDVDYHLRQFIRALLSEDLQGIDDQNIVNLITIFESEIESLPVNWHPIVFLRGVWLELESIKLETGITLRRPKETDFEYEEQTPTTFHSPFDINPPKIRSKYPKPPSAVIEFSKRSSSSTDITQIINQHLVLLHLYDVGFVQIANQEYNPETILSRGYPTAEVQINERHLIGTRYTIEDKESFQQFVGELHEMVMEKLIQAEEDTALTIAYDRYANALDESQSPERRLTSAIMCLEALFLKEEERGELSERLSRRTGVLLHQFGFQPNEVSRYIKQAYHVRSQYVHGSKLEEDKSAEDFLEDIMEYARRSLVIFLQLEQTSGKDSLISKIDNSSINPRAIDSLESFIENECDIKT